MKMCNWLLLCVALCAMPAWAAPDAGSEPTAAPASPLRWNLDAHDMSTLASSEINKKADVAGRFEEIVKAAQEGDVTAQMLAGQAYWNGFGTSKDADKAVYWADAAAKAGNARAMLVLAAVADERGDTEASMAWRRRAADGGVGMAMLGIASTYESGDATHPADPQQSLAWLRRAADAGMVEAMGMLGAAYMNGAGVPQDEAAAASWIRKAAELGDLQAMYMMGQVYLTGRGADANPGTSLEWLDRCIALGSADCLRLHNEITEALTKDIGAAAVQALHHD